MIHRVLTDNESNMIAAFKEQVISNENCSFSDDNDVVNQDILCSSTNQVSIRECSDDERDSHDEEIRAEVETPQLDIRNFDECEDHTIAFVSFKRTNCFGHTLQLVVRVFDGFKSQKTVLKQVHKLVSKVNKSTKQLRS